MHFFDMVTTSLSVSNHCLRLIVFPFLGIFLISFCLKYLTPKHNPRILFILALKVKRTKSLSVSNHCLKLIVWPLYHLTKLFGCPVILFE